MKTLVLLTAATGVLVSSALAQTSNMPGPNAPGGTQAGPAVIASQNPDHWLASKFKGTAVLGADDQKIGTVSDVLFQRDGKVVGYVVSVGGFLGMGAKDVALAPDSFQVQPGQDATDFKLKVAMTKDQLKDAQAFAPYKPPAPTTGIGGPNTRPTGTGLPPVRPTGSAQ